MRTLDKVARRVDEKKFELTGEARDTLEDLLMPYREIYREQLLSEIPIEKRRELEAEEKRARENEDE